MTLRYQIDPAEPLTFLDVKVGKQVRSRLRLYARSSIVYPFHGVGIRPFINAMYHALIATALRMCRAIQHKHEPVTLM